MEVRKKEGESASSLLYRFSKKMKQSGLTREVRKRRFHARPQNKSKRRASALYRETKRSEVQRLRKLGVQ